jgi:hypothetical protein
VCIFDTGKVRNVHNEQWALDSWEIVEFVTRALNHDSSTPSTPLIVGIVSDTIAANVLNATGLDIKDAQVRILVTYIKHTHKKHGGITEYKRGQLPVEALDYGLLSSVLTHAEEIVYEDSKNSGVLIFRATLGMKRSIVFALNYRLKDTLS